MSKRINITMNDDLMDKLKSLASDKGLNMSAYLRLLIAEQWEQKK